MICGAIIRVLQKLRIGHDHRQGRFQLVGGRRHKLPLLLPGTVHRPYRPLGQQNADPQERQEAEPADQKAGSGEIVQGGDLAGDIRKHHAGPQRRVGPVIAQVIFLNDPQPPGGGVGDLDQTVQEVPVGQVVIAAAG